MGVGTMPFFSVIIPVHNGLPHLVRCLAAVQKSRFRDWELIVVVDGATDGSSQVAEAMGAKVLYTRGRVGPAAARNLGATQATGPYFFFTDADCELHEDTLGNAAALLQADPHLDALIGSYDDEPAHPGFISQYKNLLHHFTHQTSREDAHTFWTGCGAIRKSRFLALGGFDAARYPRPSIEDIELGYRLKAAGGTIRLARQVQVKHLKRWTLFSLLRSDIVDRAIPWTHLLRERKEMPRDLNLQLRDRMSAAALLLMILQLSYSFLRRGRATSSHLYENNFGTWMNAVGHGLKNLCKSVKSADKFSSILVHRRFMDSTHVLCIQSFLLILLNHRFYRFLWHKRGFLFLLRAIPLHWFYYLYSSLTFVVTTVKSALRVPASA